MVEGEETTTQKNERLSMEFNELPQIKALHEKRVILATKARAYFKDNEDAIVRTYANRSDGDELTAECYSNLRKEADNCDVIKQLAFTLFIMDEVLRKELLDLMCEGCGNFELPCYCMRDD